MKKILIILGICIVAIFSIVYYLFSPFAEGVINDAQRMKEYSTRLATNLSFRARIHGKNYLNNTRCELTLIIRKLDNLPDFHGSTHFYWRQSKDTLVIYTSSDLCDASAEGDSIIKNSSSLLLELKKGEVSKEFDWSRE